SRAVSESDCAPLPSTVRTVVIGDEASAAMPAPEHNARKTSAICQRVSRDTLIDSNQNTARLDQDVRRLANSQTQIVCRRRADYGNDIDAGRDRNGALGATRALA